jgi:hypothetical protein
VPVVEVRIPSEAVAGGRRALHDLGAANLAACLALIAVDSAIEQESRRRPPGWMLRWRR